LSITLLLRITKPLRVTTSLHVTESRYVQNQEVAGKYRTQKYNKEQGMLKFKA
jgi:hypothetical protein